MKLTQSQRADLLAQFFISKATAGLGLREKLDGAKEMLQAYEDELATWPELPPPVYGSGAQQMADSFQSDVPVPLTDEQWNALAVYPRSLDDDHHAAMNGPRIQQSLPKEFMESLVKAAQVRNPENIDFSKYPIPPGYTVASDADCKCPARNGWLLFTSGGWQPTYAASVVKSWTYLRPLRKDEK